MVFSKKKVRADVSRAMRDAVVIKNATGPQRSFKLH